MNKLSITEYKLQKDGFIADVTVRVVIIARKGTISTKPKYITGYDNFRILIGPVEYDMTWFTHMKYIDLHHGHAGGNRSFPSSEDCAFFHFKGMKKAKELIRVITATYEK